MRLLMRRHYCYRIDMDGFDEDTELMRALVRHAGTSAAAVARKAKISNSTVQRPHSGTASTRIGRTTLNKLKSAFPDFPGWEPDLGAPMKPEPSTLVSVQMMDFGYGMGGTYLDEALQEATTEQFPRAFLQNYTRSPANKLFFTKGIGDSMMPTIHNNDLVLIDRSQDTPRMDDQIWAIARGDIGSIKRLRFTGSDGQTVVIMSDNENISDDIASDGELTIIGRIVAIMKNV